MGDGSSKRIKGQIQVYEGNYNAEPVVQTLFDYNQLCMVELIGEAKFSIQENDNRWFIQKVIYGPCGCVVAGMKTAVNKITTGTTSVTIDPISVAPHTKITFNDGDIEEVAVNDFLYLTTPLNHMANVMILQKPATNVLIVDQVGIVEVAAAPTNPESVYIKLESDYKKDFDRRRWDKRRLYLYQ